MKVTNVKKIFFFIAVLAIVSGCQKRSSLSKEDAAAAKAQTDFGIIFGRYSTLLPDLNEQNIESKARAFGREYKANFGDVAYTVFFGYQNGVSNTTPVSKCAYKMDKDITVLNKDKKNLERLKLERLEVYEQINQLLNALVHAHSLIEASPEFLQESRSIENYNNTMRNSYLILSR